MATNALTCYASTLVSNNMASRRPLPVGLGRHPVLPPTPSSKAPSSRPSLVVKAQQSGSRPQGGGPNKIEPVTGEGSSKKVSPVETSPDDAVGTLWTTSADANEIKIWFDTTAIGADNIEVDVENDLLVMKGIVGRDKDGNKKINRLGIPFRLPFNALKKEIKAELKNGMLYITVPKISDDKDKV